VIVRPFRAADLEPVIALWRAARFMGEHTEAEDRAYFGTLQDVWVGERDGVPLGFMALSPGWVEQLHVAPAAQRTGVGGALLEHAKAQMQEIRLHTHLANAKARAFYAKHGFEEIAFGVSPPPESAPDVLLRWTAAREDRA
jgi:ribosomal protein S18 acetylase RimI-like enzyme